MDTEGRKIDGQQCWPGSVEDLSSFCVAQAHEVCRRHCSCVAATMCTLVPWWWDCGADDTLAHSSSGQNLAGLRCWPHVVLWGGHIACVRDDDDRARHVLALLYDDGDEGAAQAAAFASSPHEQHRHLHL